MPSVHGLDLVRLSVGFGHVLVGFWMFGVVRRCVTQNAKILKLHKENKEAWASAKQACHGKIEAWASAERAWQQVDGLRRKTLHIYCARTDHPTPPRDDALILRDRDKHRVLTLDLIYVVPLALDIKSFTARHGIEAIRFHVVERQPGAWLLTEVAPNPEWVTNGRSTRDYTPLEFAALVHCLLMMMQATTKRGLHRTAAGCIQRAWRSARGGRGV